MNCAQLHPQMKVKDSTCKDVVVSEYDPIWSLAKSHLKYTEIKRKTIMWADERKFKIIFEKHQR